MEFYLSDILDIVVEYIYRNKSKSKLINSFYLPIISFININKKYYRFDFCKKHIGLQYNFNDDKTYIGLRFVEPPEVCPPVRDISLNYNIDIFNNSRLDSSLKFVHFFDDKELPTMNPYFWSNLSVENQTELNKIYELLNQIKDVNSNNNFIICK